MPGSDPGFRSLLAVQGVGNACGVDPSGPRTVKLVFTLCAASCIFILSGHFVCGLTSDAKSRAPIKALRNKATACLGAGAPPPPGRAPPPGGGGRPPPPVGAGGGPAGRQRGAGGRGCGEVGVANLSSEGACSLRGPAASSRATGKRQQRRTPLVHTRHTRRQIWTQTRQLV